MLPPAGDPRQPEPHGGLAILVVDDDEVSRRAPGRLLRSTGERAAWTEAVSAGEGVAAMRTTRFDCVLLDHRLPDGTAFDVLGAFGRPYAGESPVVVCTAHDDDPTGTQLLEAGAQDYVSKRGLTGRGLRRAIRHAMTRWAIQRRLDQATAELRLSQQRLTAAEEHLRRLIDELPIGLYVEDPGGRVRSANPALLRLLACDAPLMSLGAAGPAGARHDREAFRQRLDQEGSIRGHEARWRTFDGRDLWLRENATRVRDPQTGDVFYEGLIEDITERRRLEEEKDALIALVSHELRAPLTSLLAALTLFDRLTPDPAAGVSPAGLAYLGAARANAQRMQELIENLLDLERIESGRRLSLSTVAIEDVLAEASRLNEPYLRRLDVTLAPAGDAAALGLRVHADRGHLVQALTNLLTNAAKFSPPGATVVLGARRDGDAVRLWVADPGPGVPETLRDRLFQRFAQGGSRDPRHRGSGLGLALTRTIAEAHGGSIGYAFEPGAGSTFWLQLPLLP